MPMQLDPQHTQIRDALRIIGPAIVIVGLIFLSIGLGSFFSAFANFGPPRYFWCAFVGMPLLAVGAPICQFAFMGAVNRYMANEVAPVGKDVVNYMADGTKGSVRDLAAAVGEGLRSTESVRPGQFLHCPQCQTENKSNAKFCNGCGSLLPKSPQSLCPGCGTPNSPNARFCENCGKSVT